MPKTSSPPSSNSASRATIRMQPRNDGSWVAPWSHALPSAVPARARARAARVTGRGGRDESGKAMRGKGVQGLQLHSREAALASASPCPFCGEPASKRVKLGFVELLICGRCKTIGNTVLDLMKR